MKECPKNVRKMPSIFLLDIYLILKITQEISERSLALFKKHGGESVKSGEEEESDEGTEDVDHPRGGVRAVLDPLHRHGHLGHRRQGGRGAGARGHPGKLTHFIFCTTFASRSVYIFYQGS